jgi:putative nucleotidyltransferase with HDIG domain
MADVAGAVSMSLVENPSVEALLRLALPRKLEPLAGRERVSEALFALALLGATAGLYALGGWWSFPAWLAVGLVALLALAKRIDFRTGSVTAPPTQLVVVPMLLLFPPALAPLLVVSGCMLGRADKYARREVHPDRLLLHIGDAWSTVGSALVLALAGHGQVSLSEWPVYVAALAAGVLFDLLASVTREWAALGVAPSLQLKVFGLVVVVDAALSPVGLVAALAAATEPAAVFLVGPLLGLIAQLGREREQRIEHALALSEAYRGSALLMGEMLEADDAYTGGEHTRGVVALVLAVGEQLGLDAAEHRQLEFGALLHDIGKLRTPDEIINKPGKLTPEEWDIIKRHPVDGQAMLDRIGGVLAEVGLVVRHHHERWDGGGYPDGIAGGEIPLGARIICACDAYNAMTTNRSYRGAMPIEEATAELRSCAGTQFDPVVVEALLAVVDRQHPARVCELLAA